MTDRTLLGWEPLRLLVVATRFLTRLPLPHVELRDDDLARATGLFPLVGVVVALVAAVGALLTDQLLGPVPAAVVAVMVGVLVTGAFHEDGLADVADGWFGAWDPPDRLAIMRDSRVGTFGACALVLSLGLRVALLATLPADAITTGRPGFAASVPPVVLALSAGHVVGRAGILVARWAAPVAAAGSLSRLVASGTSAATTTVGLVVAAATAWLAVGVFAPVLLATVAVVAVALARWSIRKVGGLTGDVLGAVAQVGHVTAMAVVLAVVGPTSA